VRGSTTWRQVPGRTSAADRGSHLAFLENPSAVNGAIREFLDSTA
jgi:pimeloyl-ACP methyl ester carboxylesterase